MFRPRIYLDADDGGAGSSGGDGKPQAGDGKPQAGDDGQRAEPPVYETWVKDQPEEIRTMLEGHTRGLRSALDGEREARKALEKQVRDLAGKAEKGSEAEKQLTQLADQMVEADRRADFYEAAHAAGVSNLKLAYTVAMQDEMFDRRGNVNFEEMKKAYPELFGGATRKPAGNAGDGTNDNNPAKKSMNEFIRAAAGRS